MRGEKHLVAVVVLGCKKVLVSIGWATFSYAKTTLQNAPLTL